jgi:hypothetical protein
MAARTSRATVLPRSAAKFSRWFLIGISTSTYSTALPGRGMLGIGPPWFSGDGLSIPRSLGMVKASRRGVTTTVAAPAPRPVRPATGGRNGCMVARYQTRYHAGSFLVAFGLPTPCDLSRLDLIRGRLTKTGPLFFPEQVTRAPFLRDFSGIRHRTGQARYQDRYRRRRSQPPRPHRSRRSGRGLCGCLHGGPVAVPPAPAARPRGAK